ncbi:MAG: DUF5702 domain-containing protein [Bacilli bacterium]
MKFDFKCKSGSTIIFLAIIITTMLGISIAFVSENKNLCQSSYINDVSYLAGRSILSEYNTTLKNNYGIMGFSAYEGEVVRKLGKYLDSTFDLKKDLKTSKILIDSGEFRLSNLDLFKKEIIEYSGFLIGKDLLEKDEEGKGHIDGKALIKNGRSGMLKNLAIINSLPSNNMESDGGLIHRIKENIKNLDKVFVTSGENYFTNQYALRVFNNGGYNNGNNTFFGNEIEYIISGKKDDLKNFKSTKNKIIGIRNLLNLIYMKSDPAMMAQVTAAAAILTPGPGAIATELVIMEAWALAEARNDFKMLANRKKVPILKTKLNWAIDLDSIIKGSSKGYIDVSNNKGLTYSNYLEILMFFMNQDNKLIRMMDLIQINIQGNQDKTFLISQTSTGFYGTYTVSGRNYGHMQKY